MSSPPPDRKAARAASRAKETHPSLAPHIALLHEALPFARPTAIIDVGANPINEAPYSALLRAGACHVTGFEPQPEAFAALQTNKGPNETYHPHAVGDGAQQTLRIYRRSGLTSIFPLHLPGLRALGRPGWSQLLQEVELQTVSLDAIPDLGPCDLLKIDIQGGEKLVFDHARRVLSEAVAVIVELRYMQLYEGEPMTGGVDDSLRAQGFMLHKFLFNKSQPLRHSQSARLHRRRTADQLVDGDAVYLRHPGLIETFTDAQVVQMAFLCASVIDSHSATLLALDDLVRRGLVAADLPAHYVDALPDALRIRSPEPPQAVPEPPVVPEPKARAQAKPAKPRPDSTHARRATPARKASTPRKAKAPTNAP